MQSRSLARYPTMIAALDNGHRGGEEEADTNR